MKQALDNAVQTFRHTFKKVRRQLSKASNNGFCFSITKEQMMKIIAEEMIEAKVPATPERVSIVQNWADRAAQLGRRDSVCA